jgi:hypothetical protein
MADWWNEGAFFDLLTLLGEAPTDMLAKKARAMFPALADDRAARAEFREMLRGVAMARGK